MKIKSNLIVIMSWIFGVVIFTLGVLNLILVHPVPGTVYILLSLLYLPPLHPVLRKKFRITIPFIFLLVLGLIIFWFTLGISDLAEIYGL